VEVEGFRGRTVLHEHGEVDLSFFVGSDAPRGDLPEGDGGSVHGLETVIAVAEEEVLVAAVGVVLQHLDVLPDRHVDQDAVVFEGADGGGVAGFVLKASDEVGAGFGGGVHIFELRVEASHDRVVDRRAHARNVDLGELVSGRH
jgi:hypothetical protein